MDISSSKSLKLDEKIGQLLFIGIPTDRVDDPTFNLLSDVKPGGICLFARNIKDAEQTRSLTDEIRSASSVEPFLSIDQEGGLVDRLRRILGPMPAAAKMSSHDASTTQAEVIASALRMLGLNMNFAPVVDVIDPPRARHTNGLHSRAYGSSVEEVVEISSAFLNQLQTIGIIGCLKHFPGLGASRVDSHEELPSVDVSEDEFSEVDLFPYKRLIPHGLVNAVMVAHAAYPNIRLQETDGNGKLLPSSLSFNFVTELLRQELGYDGLVLTDDLEMGAILNNYGIGEAAVMAVLAGNDMVSICAGTDSIREAHDALSQAVASGRIEIGLLDSAVDRILKLKSKLSAPIDLDLELIASLSRKIVKLNDSLS